MGRFRRKLQNNDSLLYGISEDDDIINSMNGAVANFPKYKPAPYNTTSGDDISTGIHSSGSSSIRFFNADNFDKMSVHPAYDLSVSSGSMDDNETETDGVSSSYIP